MKHKKIESCEWVDESESYEVWLKPGLCWMHEGEGGHLAFFDTKAEIRQEVKYVQVCGCTSCAP